MNPDGHETSGRLPPSRPGRATHPAWNTGEVECERPLDALPDRVMYTEADDEQPSPSPPATASVVHPPQPQPVAFATPEQVARLTQVATPEQVAAEERHAAERARQHVAQLQRRRRRHPPAAWMRRPLEDLPVCVIDLETTGGTQEADEILEVGAVLLRGHEVVRTFDSLVDPMRSITPAAQRVHRIRAADLTGAPRIGTLLPWIRELASHRVLLFHNAGFDLGFLQRAFGEAGQELLQQPVLDTVVVARRLLGGRCGLGTLGRRLGIPMPHVHRALADARLTAEVWMRLLTVLEEAGATVLGEVPGAVGRAAARRRRTRPRHRELLGFLERARQQQCPVELAYRAATGLEPVRLHVRVGSLFEHRVCRVLDLDTGAECELRLDHIDQARLLEASRPAACTDAEHGV